MALAPDESGILGGQKWHLHTEKLHFCGFQGEQRGRNAMLFSPEWRFRSRVTKQYLHCKLRGWSKDFYNKFDGRWPPTEHAEDTEADCWENLPQMVGGRCSPTEYTELGSVGMAGMPYPPNLCASVSSVGGSSLPEGSVRSVRSAGISFLPRISP